MQTHNYKGKTVKRLKGISAYLHCCGVGYSDHDVFLESDKGSLVLWYIGVKSNSKKRL
jgi:hypothetical protein